MLFSIVKKRMELRDCIGHRVNILNKVTGRDYDLVVFEMTIFYILFIPVFTFKKRVG